MSQVFYQGLHCLLRQIRSSENRIKYTVHYIWEIKFYDPSLYTMNQNIFNVSNFMETSIGLQRGAINRL